MREIRDFLNNRRRDAPPSEINQIATLILRIYLGGAQGAEILQDQNYQFLTQRFMVRHEDINGWVLATHDAIEHAYLAAQQDAQMGLTDIDQVPGVPEINLEDDAMRATQLTHQMVGWQDRTISGAEFQALQRQVAERNQQNLPGAVEENPTPNNQLERQMHPQVLAAHIPPVNLQEYNQTNQIIQAPEIPEFVNIERVPVVGNCGCQCSIQ